MALAKEWEDMDCVFQPQAGESCPRTLLKTKPATKFRVSFGAKDSTWCDSNDMHLCFFGKSLCKTKADSNSDITKTNRINTTGCTQWLSFFLFFLSRSACKANCWPDGCIARDEAAKNIWPWLKSGKIWVVFSKLKLEYHLQEPC